MTLINILFAALACVVLLSCKNKATVAASSSTDQKESVMSTPTSSREKEVIFYTMSTDEIVAYIERTGEEGGLVMVMDDFDMSAGEFHQNSGFPDITSRFTDEKEFNVYYSGKMIKIIRDEKSNPCGAVFNDGVKEPLVIKGVKDVEEYRKIAREFFND